MELAKATAAAPDEVGVFGEGRAEGENFVAMVDLLASIVSWFQLFWRDY